MIHWRRSVLIAAIGFLVGVTFSRYPFAAPTIGFLVAFVLARVFS